LIILILAIILLLISTSKIKNQTKLSCFEEFPLMISFSLLFMFLLTSCYDLFSVYLSLEGLSLSLYVLAALFREGIISIESAIKYFSLGAISTSILLFGISIIFCLIGALDFLEIQLFLGSSNFLIHFLQIKIALLFILFGFFFKISAFPCHF